MQQIATHKSLLYIAGFSILLAAISFWLGLQDFHLLFLLPIVIAISFFAIIKTDNFLIIAGSLAPLSINFNDLTGGFGLSLPTEPIFIGLMLIFIFKFLMVGLIDKKLITHPITICVIAYLAWLWITVPFSTMPLVSAKYALSKTWFIGLFYFTFILVFKNFEKIKLFFLSFSITTLILVLFVLIKHAADGFVRSSSYGVSWPFFPDHGMYAAAIAFVVPVLFFAAFNGRVFKMRYEWMVVSGVLLLILLFGIVVSYTRATWLSLVAAIGVLIILQFKIKFKYLFFVLLLGTAYGILNQDQLLYQLEGNRQGSSDDIEGHVKSVSNISTDPSNQERINRWSCAIRMVGERPITGFGGGTFAFQYGPFQKTNELTIISTNSGDLGDAHSEYFSALSELGWPGFIAWMSMVLYTFIIGFKVIYNAANRRIKITAQMALLGIVTYHVHAFLNNYSNYDKIAVPLFGFMAVLVALDIYHNGQIDNSSLTNQDGNT